MELARNWGVGNPSLKSKVQSLKSKVQSLKSKKLWENLPSTLRQAQGERRKVQNRCDFPVRAEPVEARFRFVEQPQGNLSTASKASRFTFHVSRNIRFYPSLKSQASNLKGFTLLEVLVALAVLAVALVGLLGLHNRNLILTSRAERLSTATLLAREVLTRTQLAGQEAAQMTSGDFSDLHPGRYPEFRWRRTVRPAPVEGLWELRVSVLWGEREDERCELMLFTPLS